MGGFNLPTEVITGLGCFNQLGEVVSRYGQRALLVCGTRAMRRTGILDRALRNLADSGLSTAVYDAVRGEPTLAMVEEGIKLARREGSDVIIGLGGGSSMDTAKAIAGLVTLSGTVQEYHAGRAIEKPGLPFIAVPTTAGTGAEVTKNAVLIDSKQRVKKSIRSDHWFARVALVDPELTVPLPPSVTASSGSDALCQAIESYVSIGATPATDALAFRGIEMVGRSLQRAYEEGGDIEARSDMLYGSLLAGMAMGSARLGGVHGMAHPLGCLYHIPHGTICGLLLPYVMEYNLDHATRKYAQVAELLGEDMKGLTVKEAAALSVEAVKRILERIDIPMHLSEFGVKEADFPTIIAQSLPSGSLKHNPRPLEAEDVRLLLERAM